MRIVVNGQRREDWEARLAGQAPGAALEQVGAGLFQEGQLVVGVRVDGEDVTGQDRSGWGERADVAELVLTTETPRELLRASLKISREWLPPLRMELGSCADRFRLGEDAEAIEALIRSVEGLRLLLMGVGQIRRLLAHEDSTAGEPVDRFQEEIPRLLDEVIASQEGRDWILLADLLEYDVMEQLTRWEEISATLLERLS